MAGSAYVLLLGLLLAGATIVGWLGKSDAVRGVLSGMMGEKPEKVFGTNSLTLLLLGCDEIRKPGKVVVSTKGRSDVMMVMRLDFDHKSVSAISLPRDIRVRPESLDIKIPAISHLKINGFHAHGGAEMAQKAVENLLGIKIDRTIEIDYKAFQDLVNQVGGVDVFVERNMKYTDKAGDLYIDLKKGRQKLNGYQAMGYVRFRKAAGESDFTRQERQKQILFALKDEVLARPTTIPAVADKAVDVLNRKLNGRELGSIIWFASKVPSDHIKMGAIPVIEHRSPRLYWQELDSRKAKALLAKYGFTEGAEEQAGSASQT